MKQGRVSALLVAALVGTTLAPALAAQEERRGDAAGDVVFRGYDRDTQESVEEPADDPSVDITDTTITVGEDEIVVRTQLAAPLADGGVVSHALMRAMEETSVHDDNPNPRRRSLVWVNWNATYGETIEVDGRWTCEPTADLQAAVFTVSYPLSCVGPFSEHRLDVLTSRRTTRGAVTGTNRDAQDAGIFHRPVTRPVSRAQDGGGSSLAQLPDEAGDAPGGTDLLSVDVKYTENGLRATFNAVGAREDVADVRLLVAEEPGGEPLWVFAHEGEDQSPPWWNDFCFGGNSWWTSPDQGQHWSVSRGNDCVDHYPALYVIGELVRADGTVDRTPEVGPILPSPNFTPFDDDAKTVQLMMGGPTSMTSATSQHAFGADRSAPYAVVATFSDFPDALSGTALLGDGPLFYAWGTDFSELPNLEAALEPGKPVFLLGGTAAISSEVEQQIRDAGYEATRLRGSDRISTSLAIAEEVLRRWPGTTVGLARARGTASKPEAGWVDSISAGAWAAATHIPVVLTDSHALDPRVADFLARKGIKRTVLLGGRAALSDDVAAAVPGPQRVSGPDRDATAAAISTRLLPSAGRHILLDGHNEYQWNVGLAVAGAAARAGASILFTDGQRIPPATAELLARCAEVDVMLTDHVALHRTAAAIADLRRQAC